MTATTNAIRANTRLFITFLICIVGALIVAPSAMAEDVTPEEQALADAQYVIDTYYDGIGSISDYVVAWGYSYPSALDEPELNTLVIKVSDLSDINPLGAYTVSYVVGGNTTGYININAANTFAGQSNTPYYFGTGDSFLRRPSTLWKVRSSLEFPEEQPYELYTNYGLNHVRRVQNVNNCYVEIITTSLTPPIKTTDPIYDDALIMRYLTDNQITFDTATAWIIKEDDTVLQVPISYDAPENYEGVFYLRAYAKDPYFTVFRPVLNRPDADLTSFYNARFCVYYPFNVTSLKFYGLASDAQTSSDYYAVSFFSSLPDEWNESDNYYDTRMWAQPFVFDRTYYGNMLELEYSENTNVPVYVTWRFFDNYMSAIPKFNELSVAIDLTVTDQNGDVTIGRDTNNYNNYVTNYNQQVITGMSGIITGRTSFSGDWRGQNVNTSIDYNNNWTMPTDTNVQSLFSRVFAMGNGYVTTAVLGVLAIAFCAYVLYGKH